MDVLSNAAEASVPSPPNRGRGTATGSGILPQLSSLRPFLYSRSTHSSRASARGLRDTSRKDLIGGVRARDFPHGRSGRQWPLSSVDYRAPPQPGSLPFLSLCGWLLCSAGTSGVRQAVGCPADGD